MGQAKLVTVLQGRVHDVAVDCRKGSPTFGKHVGVDPDDSNSQELFIPEGFAHGVCTLQANAVVLYKVSAFYAPSLERGILWNDPDLGIRWQVAAVNAIISERDTQLPRLRDLSTQFSYAGAS